MQVDLSDLSRWGRGNGLEIVMLLVGSVLLARLVRWVGNRITASIDETGTEALVASEMSKHRHALAEVATWLIIVIVYFSTAVLVLTRFNVPLSTLAVPGTALGVALGFGAQRIVTQPSPPAIGSAPTPSIGSPIRAARALSAKWMPVRVQKTRPGKRLELLF